MTSHNLIFDRARQQLLKRKAHQTFHHDSYFLHAEIELILKDRLSFFKQKFSRVLVLGPTSKTLTQGLLAQGHGHDFFISANSLNQNYLENASNFSMQQYIEVDAESLPFQPKSFDLIVSFLELQNLNHIPTILAQDRHLLRSPGLYINAFAGGDSFYELRTSLLQAEIELTQGANLRIHPMIDLETALKLFTQTNFILPVVDRQFFTIQYSSLTALFQELKVLGARNSLKARTRTPLYRHILKRAEEIYKDLFSNSQGELNVTIEIIFLTGWI